jgi:hypothetical protein
MRLLRIYLAYFTIRRAIRSMFTILAFGHFAIREIPAATPLFTKPMRIITIDRPA